MKQNRHINRVAVIGSGIMGSRIACHFANIGVKVLLLDIVPFDLSEEQKKEKTVRNSIVNDALKNTLKSNPSPIYSKEFASRITTGNLEDDLHKISKVVLQNEGKVWYPRGFLYFLRYNYILRIVMHI